jgi:hypothetical protein
MQAAALLGRVAQRSQEHDDELAAALVRVQKSLSAALFDDASETQYGRVWMKLCALCWIHACLPALAGLLFSLLKCCCCCACALAGSLVGLIAFGVPTVLSTVVPKLHQYCQKLKGDSLTAGQLQVRAALVVALGRCMTWSGASEAPAILQAVQGTWLEDALHAVQPAALAFL